MMRLVAVQRCPVVPNAPQSAHSSARSRLASFRTIIGFLPHNSSEQCLKIFAAVVPMVLPTALDPVNETARTSGCSAIGAPASAPKPVTRFTTPLGSQASVRTGTRLSVESGVSWAGLITQVLPQTNAGSSFQDGIAIGKFHGAIIPQTPSGWRIAMANLFGSSEGVVGPKRRRP